jgi:hypothetical protein
MEQPPFVGEVSANFVQYTIGEHLCDYFLLTFLHWNISRKPLYTLPVHSHSSCLYHLGTNCVENISQLFCCEMRGLRLFPISGRCLQSDYLAAAVVWVRTSLPLRSSGALRHNIKEWGMFGDAARRREVDCSCDHGKEARDSTKDSELVG